jgi:hypothetical protein
MTRSVVIVAGPAISGMPSGTTPKSSGRLIFSCDMGCVSSRTARMKRMSAARDLEVPLADPDRDEDAAAQEKEEERDDSPGPRRLVGDPPALGDRDVPAERKEDGREANRIDRHEERDEAVEEFRARPMVPQPAPRTRKGNPPCAARRLGLHSCLSWKPDWPTSTG